MFWRLIKDSYLRRRTQKVMALLAVALGTATAISMLNLGVEIGDRIHRDLNSLGANIVAVPAIETLPLEVGGVDLREWAGRGELLEAELPKIKTIFWRNNIIAFAPELEVSVTAAGYGPATVVGTWFDRPVPTDQLETLKTGVRHLNPYWQLRGTWPRDERNEALVGRALAAAWDLSAGDSLELKTGAGSFRVRVSGIVASGDQKDRQIVVPLSIAQALADRPGRVHRVFVRALTEPEANNGRADPEQMTPEEYDRWYCTPYPSSIALQIEEVLTGSKAKVIQEVAASEERVLSTSGGLLLVITLAVLASAILAVASVMTATVIARQWEIALFKTLGADHGLVRWLLTVESLGLGIAGGLLGYVLGTLLSHGLGQLALGVQVEARLVLLPAALLVAAGVALAGSWLPIRRAIRLDAVQILQQN